MWICDWLLEMRTTLWQELDNDLEKLTTNISLGGFQRDLACLRQLCQHIPVSLYIYFNIIIYKLIIIFNNYHVLFSLL